MTVALKSAPVCPFCGYVFSHATSVKGAEAPQPGDFSVCISCVGIARFDDELKLVASSLNEAEDAELRDTLVRTMAAVREARMWAKRGAEA